MSAIRQCTCGAVYTAAEYASLPWRAWPDLEVEVTECACGSTMSRPLLDNAAEHRRAEGEDVVGEERAERARAWAST